MSETEPNPEETAGTIHSKETVNSNGVHFSNEEKFEEWEWHDCGKKKGVRQANLIMEEMERSAHYNLYHSQKEMVITLSVFDGDVKFAIGMLDMIKEWIGDITDYKTGVIYDDTYHNEALVVLADLREATRLVVEMLDRKEVTPNG